MTPRYLNPTYICGPAIYYSPLALTPPAAPHRPHLHRSLDVLVEDLVAQNVLQVYDTPVDMEYT